LSHKPANQDAGLINAPFLSDAEQAAILEIWQRAAEDFAPFDINVTTAVPGDLSNGVGLRVSIGGDGTWTGGTYGGASYINSFNSAIPNTSFVFPENISYLARNIGDAVAHEAGHAFGLEHQSQYDGLGNLIAEYNPGTADVGPIMGISYSATQSLWQTGPTPDGSTVIQDDLAVLSANAFGYRVDDYGSTFGTAETLSAGIASTSGVIEIATDQDVFSFETFSDGAVVLDVAGADVGPNLDIELELYDSGETLILADDPANSLAASINTTLTAGQYYVVVKSDGEYGEIGQYTLDSTIPDNTPPVLSAITDQTITHNQDTFDVTLSSTDADDDTVTYTATGATGRPLTLAMPAACG
jgi:hypothetical protein